MQLPTPSIDHLLRMCDDTGPARYARFFIPDWQYGYKLDDTCSTLVAAIAHYKSCHDKRALPLAEICMGLLQTLIDGGEFSSIKSGLTYDRQPLEPAEPKSAAKALWALGNVMVHGPEHFIGFTQDVFHQLLPKTTCESLAAASYIVLGTAAYLRVFPGATFVRRVFNSHFAVLNNALRDAAWINSFRDMDWPIAVHAHADALQFSEGETGMLHALIAQMIERTQGGKVFLALDENPPKEELSVTAGSFIVALVSAFRVTGDQQIPDVARAAMDWFLGANRHTVSLYDFTTRGCHDALSASGLNKNQGIEATVHFLIALFALQQMENLQALKPTETLPKDDTSQAPKSYSQTEVA